MKKHGRYLFFILVFLPLLTGCLGGAWTGVSLFYNRHMVYKKVDDYKLALSAHHLLFDDETFKQNGSYLDLAVFNGDVLLAGHLPNQGLRQQAELRLKTLTGYRKLFTQVAIGDFVNNTLEDTWITAKIRSQIVADSDIDPNTFKVITSDRIVYVMGDAKPKEAKRVLEIASNTEGVIRVVKLLRYYNLSENPA